MFAQALTEIIRRLDRAKTHGLLDRYALIDGLAVSAWGAPRATRDIDFAVALGSVNPESLSTDLGGRFERASPDDPLRGVFRISIAAEEDHVPVQLILFPPHLNEVIFRDMNTLSLFRCAVPVVCWQSLILLKLYAGGPQDFLDVREILAVRQPDAEALDQIASLAGSLGLAEEFQRVTTR